MLTRNVCSAVFIRHVGDDVIELLRRAVVVQSGVELGCCAERHQTNLKQPTKREHIPKRQQKFLVVLFNYYRLSGRYGIVLANIVLTLLLESDSSGMLLMIF